MRARLRLFTMSIVGATAILAMGPLAALGAISASVADVAFGQLTYSHAQQLQSGTLTVTATDTGILGTNSGWNVTLRSSTFAYSGPNNGTPIPAANLAITTARPPTRISGAAINPDGGPRTTGVTGALDVTRKTLHADGPGGILGPYYGIGTYQQLVDVSLAVPGQTRAGTYTATLTVTISAGP